MIRTILFTFAGLLYAIRMDGADITIHVSDLSGQQHIPSGMELVDAFRDSLDGVSLQRFRENRLKEAIRQGRVDVVEVLIGKGDSVDQQHVHAAIHCVYQTESVEILRLLLANGANVLTDKFTTLPKVAVRFAVVNRHKEALRLILDRDPSCLKEAFVQSRWEAPEMIAWLVEQGYVEPTSIKVRINLPTLSAKPKRFDCDADSTVQDLRSRVAKRLGCSRDICDLFIKQDNRHLSGGTLSENGLEDNIELVVSMTKVTQDFVERLDLIDQKLFAQDSLGVAIRHGRVDVVEALLRDDEPITETHVSAAVHCVHKTSVEESMKILRLLLDKSAKASKDAVESAVFHNHKEALRLILDRDPSLLKAAFDLSRGQKAPEMIAWLIEEGYVEPTYITVRVNHINGQEHLVECDENSTVQDFRSRVCEVVGSQHVQLFTVGEDSKELTNLKGTLSENGVVDDTELAMIIPPGMELVDAFRDSLDGVSLARFRENRLRCAIRQGRVDVVEVLLGAGDSIDRFHVHDAIANLDKTTVEESMKILRLLLANGAKLNQGHVSCAVVNRHKEALRLILDRDPCLVKAAFDMSRGWKAPEMIAWLVEQGYVEPPTIITVHVNDPSGQDHEFQCDANSTLQDLRSRIAQTIGCSPEHIELYTEEDGRELTYFEGTLSANGLKDNMQLEVDVERAIITVRKNGLIGQDLEFEFNADSTLQDLRSQIAQTMDCSPEHIELYSENVGRELTNFEGTLSDNGLEANMEVEVDMYLVIHDFIGTLDPTDQLLFVKDSWEVAIRHGRVDVVEALLLNQEPITDDHIAAARDCLPIYNLLQKHKCIREH